MQAIGRILYVAGGSIIFIAATHMMSVENVAAYALVLALLSFVWTMADLGTTATLGVMIAGYPEHRSRTLGAFFLMRLGLAVTAGAVGGVLAPFMLPPEMLPVTFVACA